jgi:RND family efflux transporter MFP subunit
MGFDFTHGTGSSTGHGRWLRPLMLATLWLAITGCGPAKPDSSKSPGGASEPTVAVVAAQRGDIFREVVFQGEFRPFQDVDLHARIAGFVKSIDVDVGDRVTQGQVLAQLEVPELAEDITRARALAQRAANDVRKAQEDANRAAQDVLRATSELRRCDLQLDDAQATSDRIAAVAKERPGLVAQQDVDSARTKAQIAESQRVSAQATLDSALAGQTSAKLQIDSARDQAAAAEADVARLAARMEATKISAPFPGIIAKRYADAGDMIRGGLSPSSPAVPLVRLVDERTLRLHFPIAASSVTKVQVGDLVTVTPASDATPLKANVARITREVEAATRTMEAQIDIPNPKGLWYPGMSATVAIRVDAHSNVVTAPLTSISRGKSPTVYVVQKDQTIAERPVVLGLESATQAEILSGLAEGELVLIGSRSQVRPGQKVLPKTVTPETTP